MTGKKRMRLQAAPPVAMGVAQVVGSCSHPSENLKSSTVALPTAKHWLCCPFPLVTAGWPSLLCRGDMVDVGYSEVMGIAVNPCTRGERTTLMEALGCAYGNWGRSGGRSREEGMGHSLWSLPCRMKAASPFLSPPSAFLEPEAELILCSLVKKHQGGRAISSSDWVILWLFAHFPAHFGHEPA